MDRVEGYVQTATVHEAIESNLKGEVKIPHSCSVSAVYHIQTLTIPLWVDQEFQT